MTIRTADHVANYAGLTISLTFALENLTDFVESLPAPDDNETVPNIDYGHLGKLIRLHEILAEAALLTDNFNN